MCGVLAIIDRGGCSIQVAPLLDLIRHRGPDDQGWLISDSSGRTRSREPQLFSGNGALLGHCRLSIIDLSPGGWQPMSTPCQSFHITFNGEIYNYLELRGELEQLGHEFLTSSDTEVLLASWQQWGEASLSRLKGMYAFCILDEKQEILFAVRDPFGIKPLHWARYETGIALCSEIPPLLSLPGVTDQSSPQFALDFLVSGAGDNGPETVFTDVQRVEPGRLLRFDIASALLLDEKVFYSVNAQPRHDIGYSKASARLRELFLQSVDLHMRSDVALGACLSGGIDSSAIVCAMRHLNEKAEIKAFTFVSQDPKHSEEKWARLVADHAGATIYTTSINASEFDPLMQEVLDAQIEPIGSTTILAQYKVFKLAASHGIKVVLDGQGADEMLAGYRVFRGVYLTELLAKGELLAAWRLLAQVKATTGRSAMELLLHALNSSLSGRLNTQLRQSIGWGFPREALNQSFLKANNLSLRYPKPGVAFDLMASLRSSLFETGLQNLLRYEDRNSMALSIESRVPFLLPELVEFVQSLPSEYIMGPSGETKRIFRSAMRGIVPDQILDRKDKVGFQTEERIWLANSATFGRLGPKRRDVAELINTDRALEKIAANIPRSDSDRWVWRLCNLLAMPDQTNCHASK